MNAPLPVVDVHAGRAALAEHLERFLKARSLGEVGWAQPDDLTLLIPLFGTTSAGAIDPYLLRLHFDCYPAFPPTARFINPLTGRFDGAADAAWLPKINLAEIKTHLSYGGWPDGRQAQLICTSMNCDFYAVRHSVQKEHMWDPERHTFSSTLAEIRKGMGPSGYSGRMTA